MGWCAQEEGRRLHFAASFVRCSPASSARPRPGEPATAAGRVRGNVVTTEDMEREVTRAQLDEEGRAAAIDVDAEGVDDLVLDDVLDDVALALLALTPLVTGDVHLAVAGNLPRLLLERIRELAVVGDEQDAAVVTITLNRPDAMNGFDTELRADLLAALTRAAQDAQVRVVVLTGAGRCFSAGVPSWPI